MKITLTISLLAALALVGAAGPAGASGSKTGSPALVIRHQLRGCHSWSLNGGAYTARQTVVLARGGSISVTNNDVMPHKLVQTAGPAVVYTRLKVGMGTGVKTGSEPAILARVGAASKITFAKAGVYRFTTRPGEDYMTGVKTVGEDNVLRLSVRVR
jgi:plastocyanin